MCALYGQAFAVFLFPIKLYSSFLGAFSFTLDHRNAMNCYALNFLSLFLFFLLYFHFRRQNSDFTIKLYHVKVYGLNYYCNIVHSFLHNSK